MQTLKEMPIWVVWKYETVNGKRTKVLYSAKTKNKCGTNEKYKTGWVLFKEASDVATNANFDGVGFVIPKGYAVIDMDHLEDENVPQQIGTLIPSYMEVSPSGEGRHIVAKVDTAAIPTEGGKLAPSYYVKNPYNHLELYIRGLTNRYMTFTGNAVKDIAVVDCTQGILAFLEKYMKRENFHKASSIVDEEEEAKKLSDLEIIQIAGGRAKNADKFNKLYVEGNKSEYGSGSEADLALCNYLAFYSQGDEVVIDRLYRSSAIMREKWEREDYRKSTIQKAIALCGGEFYTGKVPMPPFIWEDEKERRHVSCPLLAKYFREHQHAVQQEIARREEHCKVHHTNTYAVLTETKPLSGKIICGECGHLYTRVTYTFRDGRKVIKWRCASTNKAGGRRVCSNRYIMEDALVKLFMMSWNEIAGNYGDYKELWNKNLEGGSELLRIKTKLLMTSAEKGKIKELDADLVIMVLDHIKVYESGRLTIRFFDGTEFECETE